MAEFEGRLAAGGRIAVVVSRYHERVTARLLEGAMVACLEAGVPDADVDVLWVSGAFELGVVVTAAAHSGRYAAVVALGAVIRGETYHFEVVSNDSCRALMEVQLDTGIPVANGILTCENDAQALARTQQKGSDCARAAIEMSRLLRAIGERVT